VHSLTEENYLKALYHLTSTKDVVNVKELAEYFAIKMPTVTSMIKKLASKNLVHYESYKPLSLTENGQKEAAQIVRKHRLTEMFLVEKMGVGWEHVHDIAEQIEHIQSPLFFDKMDELLDFPTHDPHGSPIPDKNGKVRTQQYLQLSECTVGSKIEVRALVNSSKEFLEFLNAKNLKIGTVLTVVSVESFDKTMTVHYIDQPSETFSHRVCKQLLVVPIDFKP